MALKITENHGILEIKGNIIGKNAILIKNHFEEILSNSEFVILSVDHVQKIDITGVKVLQKLYKNAMKLNKVFYIIGKQNKVVQHAFGTGNYILRNDIV